MSQTDRGRPIADHIKPKTMDEGKRGGRMRVESLTDAKQIPGESAGKAASASLKILLRVKSL